MTISNKLKGCLVGLVVGDDNGGPSAMMMKVLEYITYNKPWDMRDVGRQYLEWFKEDGFDAGLVTHKVLELVDSGLSFDAAAKQVDTELDGMTAGVSPAHRSIPLILHYVAWYLRSPNFFEESPNTGFRDFESTIKREARLTHLHKEAGEVSVAVNAICLYLILGRDIFDSTMFGLKFVDEDLRVNIENNISARNSDRLKSSGYAPDALTAALWFLFHTDTLKDALEQSKAFAGAANYCPVLVGSIGGAMYGYKSIKSNLDKHTMERVSTIPITVDCALTI